MLKDAWLVFKKDLRIEIGSMVNFSQILPFGLLMLVLFGFAVTPELRIAGRDLTVLAKIAPGLFWITVLLASLLILGRAFLIESEDGALDALKLAGLDPAGVFLGKSMAVFTQLVALEIVVGSGALLFYGAPVESIGLLAATTLITTLAITIAGTLYRGLVSGSGGARESMSSLLVLPALAPVLVAATLSTDAALFGSVESGSSWLLLIGAFTLLYSGIGMLTFGAILEES